MDEDVLTVVEGSRALNPAVFSLIRLQLLSNLADLGPESATYRELKAALQLSDGALHSNLKALEGMGYVRSTTITLEGKELKACQITVEGMLAWRRTKVWLRRFLGCGGEVE
ncbi:MAG: transcriptional regulator [Thermoplasmata archaeon]|nr:transcriptional regulator [Thermoplasmata archaeon]